MQVNNWEPTTDESFQPTLQPSKPLLFPQSLPLPENLKLSDITPLNLVQQRQLFLLSKYTINPIFTYKLKSASSKLLIHTQYQPQALKILKMKTTHSPSSKKYLSKQQLTTLFQDYISKLNIRNQVKLQFDSTALSRTKVKHLSQYSVMIMRDPPTYTKDVIQGVLDHEIGTHIVRKLNDKRQKYYKMKKTYNVSRCRVETQEGLATLNQFLNSQQPLLFIAALRYISSILASKSSFKDIFSQLFLYLNDQTQAWNETVRCKRSLTDTSKQGGFYKDQAYFIGAVEILRERKEIDFVRLHGGKINIEDTECVSVQGMVRPEFLDQEYFEKLGKIAEFNQLE